MMKTINWIKMSYYLFVTYSGLSLLIFTPITESRKLPPVHWNSSNPMFKTSNNNHIIEVEAYDALDFVCPYHPHGSTSDHEYYQIYFVSKREYNECVLEPGADCELMPVVNCNTPKTQKRFTLLFDPFSSIPNVPEYPKGGTYYYITTSTGHPDGLSNVHEGACLYRNMKLTIKVCCDATTTTTPRPRVTTPITTHIARQEPPAPTTPHGSGGWNPVGGLTSPPTKGGGGKYTKTTDDENSSYPKNEEQRANHAAPSSSLPSALLLLLLIAASSSVALWTHARRLHT